MRLTIVATLAFLAAAGGAAAAAGHPLGPGDSVRIAVMDRPELTGDYRVRDDDAIVMHLIGAVPAAGSTAAELQARVATALAAKLGTSVSVTLEVVAYRPVSVIGDVAAPGAYPFREGMTALEAVALAGGYLRAFETDSPAVALQLAEKAAAARTLRLSLAETRLLAARLRAERNVDGELVLDPETEALAGPAAAAMAAEHGAILRERRAALKRATVASRDQANLAAGEAEALARQGAELDGQIDASVAVVSESEDLQERGLTVSDRVLRYRRDLAEYRIERLSTAAFEARAAQNRAASDARALQLVADRDAEIAEALAAAATEERALRLELSAAEDFLAAFGGGSALAAGGAAVAPAFEVRRRATIGARQAAGPDTPLEPGDVVTVRLEPEP